ncbi:MAG TPA: Gfo/Idh/MocA family oxidoreductase, partial [Abditibacteriaceae bacterium]
MNIGFIGAGNVAQLHLQNLSKMKGVKISAICDIAPERAAKVAALYDANHYKDYQQMLKAEQLDACYVCVIPGAHGNIEIEIAEAKIPLYVETPSHLNLTTCQKVIDTLEKNNTI